MSRHRFQNDTMSFFPILPSGWREERLNDIVELRTSNVDKKSDEGEKTVRLCNYVDVYKNDKITLGLDFMVATATEAQIERFNLRVGDVVITKDSETPDDIGIPALITETAPDIVCGYHLTILRPNASDAIGDYLFYAVASRLSAYQFYLAANGVTRFGLTYQGTKNLRIALPPLPEQRQIAAFLDWKTGQIDALIAKKKELLEKLKEKRLAVITQAVTRGLDPNAPLKDSGIPWLGMVPEHWEQRRLKFCVTVKGGGTPNTSTPEYWDGNIPWVSPKDMKFDFITEAEDNITQLGLTESASVLIEPNTVLVVVRSGILRHTIPVALNMVPVAINQDMKALRANECLLDAGYLMAFIFGNQKALLPLWTKPGCTVESIEVGYMLDTVVPLPPIEEQKAIAKKLEAKRHQILKMESAAEFAVARLTEYRTALITAATTGKIDVRGVKIPEPGLATPDMDNRTSGRGDQNDL